MKSSVNNVVQRCIDQQNVADVSVAYLVASSMSISCYRLHPYDADTMSIPCSRLHPYDTSSMLVVC